MARINILIIKGGQREQHQVKDEKVRLTKELGIPSEIRGKDRCRYT